jgi:hypothetical protein
VTLSFWKVMFSAQEVLDLIAEVRQDEDCGGLQELENRFAGLAESRSRE